MRAKIVATIGPASRDAGTLGALVDAGLAVARLNMAHADHSDAAQDIRALRAVASERGRPIAIMADLGGPKIRTGDLPDGPVSVDVGDQVVFMSDPVDVPGAIKVSYPSFAMDLRPGEQVLISDGAIRLTVEKIDGPKVVCRVDAGGVIGARQGINLPLTSLSTPTITKKDRADLEFCLENGVDIIAMSFVRHVEDIRELQAIIKRADRQCPVVAKIENREAVSNLREIISAADGVMIARGDLGVEVPAEDVPILQKQIIGEARKNGKASIIATQMLESMIHSPIPTRAEAGDVANGVFEGADAVMLSGETAVGEYPVKTVETMARIIRRAEASVDYETPFVAREPWAKETITDAISYSTCHLASILSAAAIVTSTETGRTARQVARYRPRAPIIAISPDIETVRRLMLWWGVVPVKTSHCSNIDEMLQQAIEAAKGTGLVQPGDSVVLTAGALVNVPGTTNLIKVEEIE